MWGVQCWNQAVQGGRCTRKVEMLQLLGIWMDKVMSNRGSFALGFASITGPTSRDGSQPQGYQGSRKAVTSTAENLSCSLILEFSSAKWRGCSHPELLAVTQQRAELCVQWAATSPGCHNWLINQCTSALKIGCNEVAVQLNLCDPPEHSARRSRLNTPH